MSETTHSQKLVSASIMAKVYALEVAAIIQPFRQFFFRKGAGAPRQEAGKRRMNWGMCGSTLVCCRSRSGYIGIFLGAAVITPSYESASLGSKPELLACTSPGWFYPCSGWSMQWVTGETRGRQTARTHLSHQSCAGGTGLSPTTGSVVTESKMIAEAKHSCGVCSHLCLCSFLP